VPDCRSAGSAHKRCMVNTTSSNTVNTHAACSSLCIMLNCAGLHVDLMCAACAMLSVCHTGGRQHGNAVICNVSANTARICALCVCCRMDVLCVCVLLHGCVLCVCCPAVPRCAAWGHQPLQCGRAGGRACCQQTAHTCLLQVLTIHIPCMEGVTNSLQASTATATII
jgi:hypothetical protein